MPADRASVRSTAAGLRRWIESGSCQTASGAFAAWVDVKTGLFAFDYPEVTGYALSLLAAGASLSDEARAVGRRASAWLVDRVRRRNFVARDRRDNDAVYLFDLAMMASGLLSFGARSGAPYAVEAGQEVVAFLDGELSRGPISPLARGQTPGRRAWSTEGVAHLAKLTQCFLLSESYAESAALGRLVETVKRLQRPDGRIPTHPTDAATLLHPHLYAAEGLWIWGRARADEDALDRASAALRWAWAHQLESGGFPRAVSRDARCAAIEQCDATAQAVRLALAFEQRTPMVERAVARLVGLARGSEGKLSLLYQPGSTDLHLNTCAAIFAAQALEMAVPGARPISWRELV